MVPRTSEMRRSPGPGRRVLGGPPACMARRPLSSAPAAPESQAPPWALWVRPTALPSIAGSSTPATPKWGADEGVGLGSIRTARGGPPAPDGCPAEGRMGGRETRWDRPPHSGPSRFSAAGSPSTGRTQVHEVHEVQEGAPPPRGPRPNPARPAAARRSPGSSASSLPVLTPSHGRPGAERGPEDEQERRKSACKPRSALEPPRNPKHPPPS